MKYKSRTAYEMRLAGIPKSFCDEVERKYRESKRSTKARGKK